MISFNVETNGSRLCTMIYFYEISSVEMVLFSFPRNSGPMPYTVETTFDVLFCPFSMIDFPF